MIFSKNVSKLAEKGARRIVESQPAMKQVAGSMAKLVSAVEHYQLHCDGDGGPHSRMLFRKLVGHIYDCERACDAWSRPL